MGIRRQLTVGALLLVVGLSVGACSSSSHKSTTTTTPASSPDNGSTADNPNLIFGTTTTTSPADLIRPGQGAGSKFCQDDITIDKATAAATDPPSLLAALKANAATIDDFATNEPNNQVGSAAQDLVDAAKAAIVDNDSSLLNAPSVESTGGIVDTYCGVDFNGDALPAEFGAGAGTPFCNADKAIRQGVNAAQTPADVITFLKGAQDQINAFGSGVATTPADVQSAANALLTTVQAAIAANDGSQIETADVAKNALVVDLFCGINR